MSKPAKKSGAAETARTAAVEPKDDGLIDKIAGAIIRAGEAKAAEEKAKRDADHDEWLTAIKRKYGQVRDAFMDPPEPAYTLTPADALSEDPAVRAKVEREFSRLFDADNNWHTRHALMIDARGDRTRWIDVPSGDELKRHAAISARTNRQNEPVRYDTAIVWWAPSSDAWKWIEARYTEEQWTSLRAHEHVIVITGAGRRDHTIFARHPDGWRKWAPDVSDERLAERTRITAAAAAAREERERRRLLANNLLAERPDLLLELAERAGIVDANGNIKR